jgi:hypothetical protein
MAGSPGRRALAKPIGTDLLVTAVVGSRIAASRLSPHDVGLEPFENAVATGAAPDPARRLAPSRHGG